MIHQTPPPSRLFRFRSVPPRQYGRFERADGTIFDLAQVDRWHKEAYDNSFGAPIEKHRPSNDYSRRNERQAPKTECLRGHPKTPENIGNGGSCKPCRRYLAQLRADELRRQRAPKPPKPPKAPKQAKPARPKLSPEELRARSTARKRRERAERNTCRRGHKLEGDNILAVWGVNRQCRTCSELAANGRRPPMSIEERRAKDAARKRASAARLRELRKAA